MNNLIAQLITNGPVLTDGAWATQLQLLGLPIGQCPDAWNFTHPDSVMKIALSYVAAGSHIILTNTFGANRVALSRWGLAGNVELINREGARISKLAAAETALVFGSMGPCSRTSCADLLHNAEVQASFEEQAAILAGSGVNALVLETMFRLDEAIIALRAARQTGLPVVACMTYNSGEDRPGTVWSGETLEEAAAALMDAGADVIGANCGDGARQMIPICSRLKATGSLPIWMKPNAGMPDLVEGIATYRIDPHTFADDAQSLISAGADFIGGCCGTAPEYIQELRWRIGGPLEARY